MAKGDQGQAHAAARDYRALHDGLSPTRLGRAEILDPSPIGRVLGGAPQLRYWKRWRPVLRPSIDLFRHFNMEDAQKRAVGCPLELDPIPPAWERPLERGDGLTAAVRARLPRWAIDGRGQLVLLDQHYLTTTPHGIEDRWQGLAKRPRGDGRPRAPSRLVSLGPMPDLWWVDAQGRVRRHVFFQSWAERNPSAVLPFLPVLAHDERGDLHVVQHPYVRFQPDGTIEESMSQHVPYANPTRTRTEIVRRTDRAPARHPSYSVTARRSETIDDRDDFDMGERYSVGKALATAFFANVGAAFLLRGTSLSTTMRAGASVAVQATGAYLLKDKMPDVAAGLLLGSAGAAAVPLYDAGRLALNATSTTPPTQPQTQTQPPTGTAPAGTQQPAAATV